MADIDAEIIHALHRNAERAIELIEAGKLKEAVLWLRKQLPERYGRTLIKRKDVKAH